MIFWDDGCSWQVSSWQVLNSWQILRSWQFRLRSWQGRSWQIFSSRQACHEHVVTESKLVTKLTFVTIPNPNPWPNVAGFKFVTRCYEVEVLSRTLTFVTNFLKLSRCLNLSRTYCHEVPSSRSYICSGFGERVDISPRIWHHAGTCLCEISSFCSSNTFLYHIRLRHKKSTTADRNSALKDFLFAPWQN